MQSDLQLVQACLAVVPLLGELGEEVAQVGVPRAAVLVAHLDRSHAACHQCLHSCIKSAPGTQLVCTWCAPGVHLVCTWYAPGLNLVCTWYAFSTGMVCICYMPGMHLVCTWHAPGMHLVRSLYITCMDLLLDMLQSPP